MAQAPDFQPNRYRALLRLRVRQMQLDPRFRSRFDSSDLVQETLLRAEEKLPDFRGTTSAQFVQWLDAILSNAARDEIRKATAGMRDVYLEQSLDGLLADSSARLEGFLAAEQSSPSAALERQDRLLQLAEALDR